MNARKFKTTFSIPVKLLAVIHAKYPEQSVQKLVIRAMQKNLLKNRPGKFVRKPLCQYNPIGQSKIMNIRFTQVEAEILRSYRLILCKSVSYIIYLALLEMSNELTINKSWPKEMILLEQLKYIHFNTTFFRPQIAGFRIIIPSIRQSS